MADGSDDPRQIDDLVRLVERGVVVASASRYMSGGQQVGGPALKTPPFEDGGPFATPVRKGRDTRRHELFKAYSTEFVRMVGIESRAGFEIGYRADREGPAVAAARGRDPHDLARPRARACPTSSSRRGFPTICSWYRFAFGRRLTARRARGRIVTGNEESHG